ncbi:DUF421 domain-containing protein [Bdellovibrio sp. BCCA]|uniref:DUF421 domain-containing protein n=1 Tax=Bdellovibrio sp. BCCA TaxID=3136281 RepID=UPI0030F22A8A
MWNLLHPWWEYILRSAVVYAVVYLLLRIVGKKQIGEMSPFDFVLLLIISESVSAGITGGDTSLAAGLIAVSTFVLMNYFFDVALYKSKKLEDILEGQPRIIIKQGEIDKKLCEKENITLGEIQSSLREKGIEDISKVRLGVLETNGKISIIKNE